MLQFHLQSPFLGVKEVLWFHSVLIPTAKPTVRGKDVQFVAPVQGLQVLVRHLVEVRDLGPVHFAIHNNQ